MSMTDYGQSVVEWEVVQPDGIIAAINSKSSPEIFTTMKGSGNQFGIVTRFTLKTYPVGQVWGGYRIYDMLQQPAIVKALQQFVESPSDPKAAIIVGVNRRAPIGRFLQMFYFYDGPTPPSEPFKGPLEVPATILDSTQTRSYSGLLDFNGQGAGDTGMRSSFRVSAHSLLLTQTISWNWILTSVVIHSPTHTQRQRYFLQQDH
jgi:FAD/FMN-containing dehydrogenase